MAHQKKSDENIKSMTSGNPYSLILCFALPLMAGNIFQQLYTVTDTAIVGQALGVKALAALGTIDCYLWLAVGLTQGITQGFSILIAQHFGAEQYDPLKKSIGCSCTLSALCAACMFLMLQLMVNPVIVLLRVPTEIASIARLYMRIIFCGIPISMAYNMLSSILRALGDSKSPLYAMTIASAVNIGLDLLFVMVFHWGVAGAAVATLAAQLIAVLFCVVKIRRISLLQMHRSDFRLHTELSKKLFSLAAPMAFQNIVIAVGGMIVQMVVNQYGVSFIAGYTATIRLYGVLEVASISYGFAMTTYAGQNMGARNKARISQGIRAGLVVGVLTSVCIAVLMFVFGQPILGCFISAKGTGGAEAMKIAYELLKIMSFFLPVLYILHVVRSCIQGMGNTVIPMISGFSEFFMRTGGAFLLPLLLGEKGILFAEVLAWFGADLVLVPGYFLTFRKIFNPDTGR